MKVWIVEMWNDAYRRRRARWEPTVGAALGREDARKELAHWQVKNPADRFRLRLYKPQYR